MNIVLKNANYKDTAVEQKTSIPLLDRNLSTMGNSAWSNNNSNYITIKEDDNLACVGHIITGFRLKIVNTGYNVTAVLLQYDETKGSGKTTVDVKTLEVFTPKATGVQEFTFKKPVFIEDVHAKIGFAQTAGLAFDSAHQYGMIIATPSTNTWASWANVGYPCMEFLGYKL